MASMLFYTVSELWKPALIQILFWGLINKYISLDNAKQFYAPLMLSGSLGSIIAGPITTFCTSEIILKNSFDVWEKAINLIIIVIVLSAMITSVLYYQLWKHLSFQDKKEK